MKGVELGHIEEIVIAISSAEKQIIGLTSPECDDLVGSVALGVAEFLARSGRSVLLIDLQQPMREGYVDGFSFSEILAGRNLFHKEQGLNIVSVRPNSESRYAFADTVQFRSVLENLLETYQFIILELGPLESQAAATLNPLPIGAGCDCVLLTCRRGSTRRAQLEAVLNKLRAARCVVGGIILNEIGYSSPGGEIAQVVSWLLRPMPGLRRRVQRWAMNSELLN